MLTDTLADVDAFVDPTADADVSANATDCVHADAISIVHADVLASAHPEHRGRRVAVPSGVKKPYGNVRYADPGYQADGIKRYPLERRAGTLSPARVRNAWARIHQNRARYTGREFRLIEGRIRGAARR